MNKFICVTLLLLVGCANVTPMAVDKKTAKLDVNSKSIVLMAVDLARPEPSRFVPHPLIVDLNRTEPQGKIERLVFRVDKDAGDTASELHNKFLLRMALEPGHYELISIFGNANAFPFNGFFRLPLLMDIDVPANSVTYIGRVNAVLRPRTGNEFRAGSVIPLIDQAATGVSGSTFDVVTADASQDDLPEFVTKFPVLSQTEIQKSLLPAFNRDKAQIWWETDGKTHDSGKTIPEAKNTDSTHAVD